jgi:GR25 family glycosyltransferase involved in LPS biosynthesis
MNNINKIFIINLDKDKNRYEQCIKQMYKYNITNYERFPAINGSKLTEKEKKNLTTDVGNIIASSSMIGCGTSHINIWKKIIKEGINKSIILEDDFIFKDNFLNKFNYYYNYCPDNYDILYLTDNALHNKNLKIRDINDYYYKQLLVSQTVGYIISIEGARKILNYINKITYHIDVELAFLSLINSDINIISLKDPIIYQTYISSNNINDRHYPLIVDKIILRDNFVKYAYKVVLFSAGGLNLNVNSVFIVILGFINIWASLILMVIEYFIFDVKKISIINLIYLFIGYLIKIIYGALFT